MLFFVGRDLAMDWSLIWGVLSNV